MNLKVEILVQFDGSQEEMLNFVADIGQLLVEYGYGNTDTEAKSVVVVNNYAFDSVEQIETWLQDQSEDGAFIALPMDAKEENES